MRFSLVCPSESNGATYARLDSSEKFTEFVIDGLTGCMGLICVINSTYAPKVGPHAYQVGARSAAAAATRSLCPSVPGLRTIPSFDSLTDVEESFLGFDALLVHDAGTGYVHAKDLLEQFINAARSKNKAHLIEIVWAAAHEVYGAAGQAEWIRKELPEIGSHRIAGPLRQTVIRWPFDLYRGLTERTPSAVFRRGDQLAKRSHLRSKPLEAADENWAPDKSASNCTRCAVAFSLFTRQHHCRECGKIFCVKCAPDPVSGQIRLCGNCALGRWT